MGPFVVNIKRLIAASQVYVNGLYYIQPPELYLSTFLLFLRLVDVGSIFILCLLMRVTRRGQSHC